MLAYGQMTIQLLIFDRLNFEQISYFENSVASKPFSSCAVLVPRPSSVYGYRWSAGERRF